MGIFQMKKVLKERSALSLISIAGLLVIGFLAFVPKIALSEDLEKKAQDAGKDLSRSIRNGIKQSEDYLKSDSFHRTVHRIASGAAEAVRESGDWASRKLDSIGTHESPSK